jgi:hypothetical protein
MSDVVADVRDRAESFLKSVPSYIWDGRTLPVPIDDIADSHIGLLIRDVENLATAPGAPVMHGDQSLSGLLLPGRGEIWVNAQEGRQWPGRRRFTIAHELGHWQLHRQTDHTVFCRTATVEPDDKPGPAAQPLPETEANAFAAEVLMPARLVRQHYAAYGDDFFRLCNTFGVSGAAMGRRLHAVIARS